MVCVCVEMCVCEDVCVIVFVCVYVCGYYGVIHMVYGGVHMHL